MRQRLRNPFVQQYLLEILLPLIGYFFFDWSLAIIAVFYLLDQLAAEVSFTRKFLAIQQHGPVQKPLLIVISLSFFAVAYLVQSLMLFDFFAGPNLETLDRLVEELVTFAKEELWLLLPVILLMYYLKDQLTFFVPRRFLQKDLQRFLWMHVLETAVIFTLVALGYGLLKNQSLSPIALIGIFLGLKIGFDLTLVRWADRKSNRTMAG